MENSQKRFCKQQPIQAYNQLKLRSFECLSLVRKGYQTDLRCYVGLFVVVFFSSITNTNILNIFLVP